MFLHFYPFSLACQLVVSEHVDGQISCLRPNKTVTVETSPNLYRLTLLLCVPQMMVD